MKLLLAVILLVVGFVMLIKGADWFVDGAAGIAASVACKYIPIIKNLSSGWTIILITLIVCVIAAWLFPVEEGEEES